MNKILYSATGWLAMIRWIAARRALAAMILAPAPALAVQEGEGIRQEVVDEVPARVDRAPAAWIASTDLIVRLNPLALLLAVGVAYRHVYDRDTRRGIEKSTLQIGLGAGLSPALAQVGPQLEWMPFLPLQLHVQYGVYRFFGAQGSLLSFASAGSRFGSRETDALSGREEGAFGQRLLFRPTLRLKMGRIVMRNQTDLAYYRFGGRGPYFWEREFDTLLRDGDGLVSNRLAVMAQMWAGQGETGLLLGPAYEVTHAFAASLTRQRVGLQGSFQLEFEHGPFRRLRAYGFAGLNLQDRNRAGDPFLMLGIGNTFSL